MRFFLFFALLWLAPVVRADSAPDSTGTQTQRDIVFVRRGGRALHLHLVRPATLPAHPLPVVIWVHGGLWRGGTSDKIPPLLFELARHGFAGASVEFRSSREAIFPAPLDDLRAATRFLRSQARAYSLDGAHIGAAGISTGAHLAALLALSGGACAVADICGPSDLTTIERGSRLPWNAPEGALCALLGGAASENSALARAASPLFRVSKAAPPFFIAHGADDSLVAVAQSEALFQKLKAAGARVSYRVYLGEEHGLRGARDDVDAHIVRFFERFLRAGA